MSHHVTHPKSHHDHHHSRLPEDVLVPVTFTFHYPFAEKIFLAGPFNFWRGEPMKLICENSHTKIFGVIKGLREGEVTYKFIVFFENGHHEWHFDAKKPTITDQHGHVNNIIVVENTSPITPIPSPNPSPGSRSPSPPSSSRYQPSPTLVDHIRNKTPNLTLNRYLSPYLDHNDSTYSHLISHRHLTPSHEPEKHAPSHTEYVHHHQPSPSAPHVEHDRTLLVPIHENSNFVHQHQTSPSVSHVIDHNKIVHIDHVRGPSSRQNITLELPSLYLYPETTLVHHQVPPSISLVVDHSADSNGNSSHPLKVPLPIPHETQDNSPSIPILLVTPDQEKS